MKVKMKDSSGTSKTVSVSACSGCAGAQESLGCYFGIVGGLIGVLLVIVIGIHLMNPNYSYATDPFCRKTFEAPTYIEYWCHPNPFGVIGMLIGTIICAGLLSALGERIWMMVNRRKIQNHPEIKTLLAKGWKL
jgi:hypothetical protein